MNWGFICYVKKAIKGITEGVVIGGLLGAAVAQKNPGLEMWGAVLIGASIFAVLMASFRLMYDEKEYRDMLSNMRMPLSIYFRF